ncbi:MAG: hypothetical protein ACMVY4_07015 [Minwuia sp.]|uniref:hypothetical protein n=1 Tax=Minwuia sp. TaxID=2493630 RepID=UPI003A872A80
MDRSDLLERMASGFRTDVGPAIEDPYPKTLAFLSAVVLQKVAAELRLARTHDAAALTDRAALETDLASMTDGAPAAVAQAVAALPGSGDEGLCRLIEALYAEREALGKERFDSLLGRVRTTMRAAIDRRMEIAK